MIINTFYDIHISIGDIDVLEPSFATQVVCKINESVFSSVPVCEISFYSSADFLMNYPIVDGTKIVIKINSEQLNIDETYFFRVTRLRTIPHGSNLFFTINGIIDFYELFRDPIKYSMFGNSSEVFAKVVSENKLQGSIYQTNDSQLWVPTETNLGQWLSYIAAHAWSSESSAFYWFLNKKKNLYFLDIDKLIYESKNIVKFNYGDTLATDVDDRIVRYKNLFMDIKPGDENLYNSGYNGNNYHFDLLSYNTKHENANKVRAVSEIVNINKELSQGLGIDFLQFDVGNHHKNFFIADAQNKRILSTFSTYLILSCDYFRPLKLSQVSTINASSSNSSGKEINTMTIKYIVSQIITTITSSNISMDVELCSQGYNGRSTESY